MNSNVYEYYAVYIELASTRNIIAWFRESGGPERASRTSKVMAPQPKNTARCDVDSAQMSLLALVAVGLPACKGGARS